MRTAIFLWFCLALGCKGSSEPKISQLTVRGDQSLQPVPEAQTPQKKTIALITKARTNPFFIAMERGAQRAADELDVELVVKSSPHEGDSLKQRAILQEAVDSKVAAIVFAPLGRIEHIPVLHKAQEAGIVLINVDDRIDAARAAERGLAPIPFVSVDNDRGAYMGAMALLSMLEKPTEVLVLQGDPRSDNGQLRHKGILRAIEEQPLATLVATESARWRADDAYEITKRLHGSHPNLGAVLAANDVMALGAIQLLQESGAQNVLVGGYDGTDEARQALRDGRLHMTVDQQPDEQGYQAVRFAVQALDGQPVPSDTLVDVKVITAAIAGGE